MKFLFSNKTAQMLLAALLVMSFPFYLYSQISGEVVYKREIHLGDNKFWIDTLRFNGAEFGFIEKREYQQWNTEEGYRIYVHAEDKISFWDARSSEVVEQQYNFKKRRYELRKQTAPVYEWEIHDEFKTIGNYKVQKATAEHPHPKLFTITAWFTTEIPVSGGPSNIGGLPGLIVEMSIQGTYVGRYIMESIVLKPVGSLKPTEGVWVEEKGALKTDKSALRDLLNKEGN
jgi:GLPGLI family protein